MSDFRATLSILDRLAGPVAGGPATRTGTMDDVRESIRWHLDCLLNTRRPQGAEFSEHAGFTQTLLAYGLPDTATISLDQPGAQEQFALAIQNAIRWFEPRLSDVSVVAVNDSGTLYFRVRAYLRMTPAKERVRFRAVLEASTGRLQTQKVMPDA